MKDESEQQSTPQEVLAQNFVEPLFDKAMRKVIVNAENMISSTDPLDNGSES